MRVEWILANGLLSGRAKRDIDAAVVGQDDDVHIVHHPLAFVRSQVRIIFHLVFDLSFGELLLFAEGAPPWPHSPEPWRARQARWL